MEAWIDQMSRTHSSTGSSREPAHHPPLLSPTRQASRPSLTHSFSVKPQMFYLLPQSLTLLLPQAGETDPEQGSRSGWCEPQSPEGLCGILQHLLILSLTKQKVLLLWKTSCLVQVPNKTQQSAINNYRPVAMTTHIMKVLERLLLAHLNKQTRTYQNSLQFAYRRRVGTEDTVTHLLQQTHCHLDTAGSTALCFYIPKCHRDYAATHAMVQDISQRLRTQLTVQCYVDPTEKTDSAIMTQIYGRIAVFHSLFWPTCSLIGGTVIIAMVKLTQYLSIMCERLSHIKR
ncbi:calcium-activated potassium channel subunit beta-2 isoform X1 [Xiphophorus maculatus]|uniref:calcium-activated potassium channel subunit beta-2 isoform X1 n=1 Tax=Xiphophorus maculatus TaxID=8083 RepID=UPI000C6D5572|nr:calcium-activated potassium channel subunit beta-2 isoform X1 [Xiphophorus maculatus]